MEANFLFQTLIGTVKSFVKGAMAGITGGISNPHRYGQKEIHVDDMYRDADEFQTLIGTVKRTASSTSLAPRPAFQTLIGTVKSDGVKVNHELEKKDFKPS